MPLFPPVPKWIERRIFEEYERLLAAVQPKPEIILTDAPPKPVTALTIVGNTVAVRIPKAFR